MQQQTNGYDCRLFALAYAISLCEKKVPSKLYYETLIMRQHYRLCNVNETASEFPHTEKVFKSLRLKDNNILGSFLLQLK